MAKLTAKDNHEKELEARVAALEARLACIEARLKMLEYKKTFPPYPYPYPPPTRPARPVRPWQALWSDKVTMADDRPEAMRFVNDGITNCEKG